MNSNFVPDLKKQEKSSIKIAANCIGGAFLLGEGIAYLLQIVIVMFLAVLGKSEMLADDGFLWMLQIALSSVIFTLPFIIMAYPMGTSAARCCSFGRAEKGTLLPLILSGLAVCMVANLIGSIPSSIFSFFGFNSTSASFQSDPSASWYFPVISVIGGAILPAFVEEFALRGIVLGSLRRYGNNFAIIVSAAIFGIMHGNLEQIPFAFTLGLYLGFITVKTGTVWSAVLLHFINNFFAFLFDIVGGYLSDGVMLIVNSVYFCVMILIGIIGAVWAHKKGLFVFEEDKKSELRLGEKITVFSATPCIIIYLVITFIEMIILGVI